MNKKNDLTVILTLRGRHLHTLRWMWHANRVAFPYHVIVADGDVHPTVEKLLSDRATFPKLSFSYRRYSDRTFSDFYRKCVDAIREVHTPYVMMSDNDDFPLMTGVAKSIEHLSADHEYVCAGGQLPDFLIAPSPELPGKVIGELVGSRFRYENPCRDISHSSVAHRVMEETVNYQTIYYHVYRTQTLRTIFEEVEAHDFSDLTVHEYYIALRTVTLGKVASRPSAVCSVRQQGTSSASSYWVDWVHHLLHSRLPQDFQAMATAIAKEVHLITGDDVGVFREKILDAYATVLRRMLGNTMMRHRFPRLFRIKQKVLWLRSRLVVPLWLEQWWSGRAFFNRLARDCADPTLLAAYRRELAEVQATLRGDEFLSFIRMKAPDLIDMGEGLGRGPTRKSAG